MDWARWLRRAARARWRFATTASGTRAACSIWSRMPGACRPHGDGDGSLLPLYRAMEADLALADHTLVNSDFVKTTCMHAGMEASRVHVVYLGVDDQFLAAIPEFDEVQVRNRAHGQLLFAGNWQQRKGVEVLVEALARVSTPWQLRVIAGIEPELAARPEMKAFFSRSNVNRAGILPRGELAAAMSQAAIFVFPSFCEGSARVIFEAMACGCCIVTTPNAGSIVEDGVHGKVVPPGNPEALAKAIEWTLAHPAEVAAMGWGNARLVRERYQQRDYGDRVEELYRRVLTFRNESEVLQ